MYVRVHVVPEARKEAVRQMKEGTFQISVREPALQNQANRRVCELVARAHGVLPKDVRIVTGHRSPTKVLDVPTK